MFWLMNYNKANIQGPSISVLTVCINAWLDTWYDLYDNNHSESNNQLMTLRNLDSLFGIRFHLLAIRYMPMENFSHS